jgi:iron complex transport system substrate-binding protein
VAVSHECDFPAAVRTLARVTATAVDPHASSRDIDDAVRRLAHAGTPVFALNAEQLVRLAPTVILTQALCDVCAVSDGDVRSLGALLDPAPVLVPMSGTTLAGVWRDITNVGHAIGREREAEALVASITERLRRVHETLKAARAPRPRVAVIEWLDPLYVAGHWTPELVRRAGGMDVLAEPGAHSIVMEVARIRDAAPDLLLFAPCGFDAERAAREGTDLLASNEWRWAAGVQAWALDGNALTSRPGPRLADAVETIAAIVAPSLFPAPSPHYARQLSS